MNIEEIKRMLRAFATSDVVEELNKYYSVISSWEITNNARKETKHTLFLNWFFNNNKFNTNAIHKLLCLLLTYKEKQAKSHFPDELSDSIYVRGLKIVSCSSIAELPIKETNYDEGNIDLFITCDVKLNQKLNNIRKLNIIIENKIDSSETIKKKLGSSLYQTDAYYNYIKTNYASDLNLFVFLKPSSNYKLDKLEEAECHNKNYIQINYQELLDNVLQPVSDSIGASDNDKFLIEDYIRGLSKPSETDKKSITIMATPSKEKELLTKFFQQNEDLIRAAIESIGEEDLSEAMNNTPKAGIRYYKINNGDSNFTNVQVIEQFIKYKIAQQANITIDALNNEMNNYMYKKGSGRINVSDSDAKVYREELHSHQFLSNNKEYKVCKEWSDSKDTDNFAKLRKGISNKYKDFIITKVQ